MAERHVHTFHDIPPLEQIKKAVLEDDACPLNEETEFLMDRAFSDMDSEAWKELKQKVAERNHGIITDAVTELGKAARRLKKGFESGDFDLTEEAATSILAIAMPMRTAVAAWKYASTHGLLPPHETNCTRCASGVTKVALDRLDEEMKQQGNTPSSTPGNYL